MGLRSVPRTVADGYCCAVTNERGGRLLQKTKSPNSIAQMPVPVAISRTFWGFVRGAKCSFLSIVITNK